MNVLSVILLGRGNIIMSKIALITDQHFGGKQDGQHFMNYIEKFYTNQFFPYLKENNITTVIDLGDTFDRRKYVNFHTLHQVKKFYFDVLAERDIRLHSIVGNHSTYYRNTNSVNSSDLLYGHYHNVNIYSKPFTIHLPQIHTYVHIDIIPWINSENYDETMEFIKNSKSQILFGHLEIDGFAMYKGYVANTGLPKKIFNRYEVACSGHYHHKSSKDNIHYLGAPYEITWNDYDDPRGFHVFDTETRELEFIRNKYRLFEKIYYDDSGNIDYKKLDTNHYKDKIVNDPALKDYVHQSWAKFHNWLVTSLEEQNGKAETKVSALLKDLGTTLTQDSDLAKAFNKHIGEAAKYMAPELAEFLTRHIRDTINSWDEREMAQQVELNIGRDLQKVRINGTLVGGLIGAILFAVERLIGS